MKLKNILFVFSIMAFLLFPSSISAKAVQAQTSSSNSNAANAKITNLISRADREIDRRVAAMNIILKKINGLKDLTADQKTSLTTQIQANIANLNTLKTKIDADTDITTLTTDVQSIVGNYKIFALFNPKIRLLSVAEVMNNIVDKFTALSTKLATRIADLKSQGKDVTAMQASLTDLNSKIASAKTTVQAAIDELIPLDPKGYPGNKIQLQDARAKLQTAKQALMDAKKDAETIIQGLKAAGGNTSNTNTNVSPTNSNSTSSQSGTNTNQ